VISALNQPYDIMTKLEARGNSATLKTETEILNERRDNDIGFMSLL